MISILANELFAIEGFLATLAPVFSLHMNLLFWKTKFNVFLERTLGYRITRVDPSERQFREELKTFVIKQEQLISGDVLDIGTGTWMWTKEYFGPRCHLTLLDQQKYPHIDIVGNVMELGKSLDGKQFDTIFCFETLEHVKNPFLAIEEIYRALKPGGRLFASTPFRHELHGEQYGDYWRITRQGWRHLLSSFENVTVQGLGHHELSPHHYLVSATKPRTV